MKKVLAILFAVLFAFSCVSIMAFADDAEDAATEVSSIVVPETITINNVSYIVCPYCDTYCGSSEDYAKHINSSCKGYTEFQVKSKSNTCYYCGKEFKNEKALNQHYAYYVNAKDHVAICPYTGEDYITNTHDAKVSGCGAQFTIKEEYEKHVAQCPYEGQYSTKGCIKVILSDLVAFIKSAVSGIDLSGAFENVDTSSLLEAGSLLVALVKGLAAAE